MRKLITILLFFVFIMTTLNGCQTKNQDSLESLGDIYLYEYVLKDDELLEDMDTQNHYVLFVTSIDVSHLDKEISDNISVELHQLEGQIRRMKDLEDDSSLTYDIFKEKVEMLSYVRYDYFIYEIDKDNTELTLSHFNLFKNLSIKYNEETYEEKVDMIMRLG